jgi:HAD superfamily hydrolase (TIGR01493 family)
MSRPAAALADLLMAVMDSVTTWQCAAGDPALGLAWRDAVTERMVASPRYEPYEALVAEVAAHLGLAGAEQALWAGWEAMEPQPDAAALARLDVPLGFVTNTSTRLARMAAGRSRLEPGLVLASEEAGRCKPHPSVYALACRRMGTLPGDTAFVAGAPYDAAGAHAAGLRTVLVRRRPDLPGSHGPWSTVESLDELATVLR